MRFLIFTAISFILALVIVLASYRLSPALYNLSKLSPYECGFSPFQSRRTSFNVHFYLVAVLFLIFDLELILVRPWIFIRGSVSLKGFFVFLFFIIILTIGFAYEWLGGALFW